MKPILLQLLIKFYTLGTRASKKNKERKKEKCFSFFFHFFRLWYPGQKFYQEILANEGGGQFSGTDPGKKANSQISIVAGKSSKLQYFANFFRRVVFLDAFYHDYRVWM